jgi:Cof subfamily protein (haloacid dehalogenase superfamily)
MAHHIPDWQTDVSELEHFSHVRLIIVDLDGSFIRPATSSLFPSLRELYRSLSHYQVAVTIATGRAWNGAKAVVERLAIQKGMPLVLYNGAVVMEHETMGIIRQSSISRQSVERVRNLCAVRAVPMYSYWFNDPLSASFQDLALEQVFATGRFQPCDFNGLPVSDFRKLPNELNGCAAMLIEADGHLADEIRHELDAVSGLTCTASSGRFIEIRPEGVNKGVALRVVGEYLGIGISDILALGDADNDAEMLHVAGIGVSVFGSSELAINSSDYTCRYGAAEGAVELMRLVKHAKRYFATAKHDK